MQRAFKENIGKKTIIFLRHNFKKRTSSFDKHCESLSLKSNKSKS